MPHANNMTIKRALSIYILVSLFLFFEMALQVSPSVMSSQLMSHIGISAFGLGVMSGCYFYTYTLMQIPSGLLFDRYNPKSIIITSIVVCAFGNLLLNLSPNLYFACLSRLLMGLGSAFAFVSVLVVTKDLFANKLFTLMTGVTQALAALGAMAGQLPISVLVESIGWQSTLMILSACCFALACAIYAFLNYCQDRQHEGSHLNQFKWLAKIFSNRQTWAVAAYAFLMWAPMSGFASLWGVPFLKSIDQLSSNSAAFLCSLMWLGLAIASPLLGYISTRMQNKKPPLALSSLLGLISFGVILSFQLNITNLGIALFLAGAACSGQALTFSIVKENNPKNIAATSIAFNNMAVVISGAIFQPLMGWIVEHAKKQHVENFIFAGALIAGAYAIALMVALFLIKNPRKAR